MEQLVSGVFDGSQVLEPIEGQEPAIPSLRGSFGPGEYTGCEFIVFVLNKTGLVGRGKTFIPLMSND